jgi:hypothetical protein
MQRYQQHKGVQKGTAIFGKRWHSVTRRVAQQRTELEEAGLEGIALEALAKGSQKRR